MPINKPGETESAKTSIDWRETECHFLKFISDKALCDILDQQNSLIEKAIEGKDPVEITEEPHYLLKRYDVFYKTNLNGWPIGIDNIETGDRTPEYVAERSGKTVDYVLKNFRDVNKKFYGCRIVIEIAKLDEARRLIVSSYRLLRKLLYGEHLRIDDKNCPIWYGIKFDLDIKNINESGYFVGMGVLDFAKELFDISQKCKAGIGIKPLHYKYKVKDLNGILVIPEGIHIYPSFEKNLDDKTVKEKLLEVYKTGKQKWGDAFYFNEKAMQNADGDLIQFAKKLNQS
ncbi:hypothetical protein HZA39_00230 [Candidatus Peregrinibacteria bacterium]|nr:hypothetical protein [Candidatus Peregrinibacteria bacterium]